jgi:iron-sulfur cluster insertion protein
MIHLTEKAVEKLKEIADAEGELCSIRVKVQGGGCAGFSYDLMFDSVLGELDEEMSQDGVKIICDPISFQYLDEVEIDYVDSPIGSGFKFNNPNATGSCGCGSSFSV